MANIKFLKLSCGDEIIGDVLEINDTLGIYRVSKPLRIVLTQQGIQFLPYPLVGPKDNVINIDIDHMVFESAINPECESAYIETFSEIRLASPQQKGLIY